MYKLLIVDDEPLIIRGIKALVDFEKLSIDVVYEAKNGQEALELVNNKPVDIVLCDINMPRINGLEFSRILKESNPQVKIAILTGYNYFDYAQEAIKIGVDDYILKPVSRDDISEVLLKLTKKIEKEKSQTKINEAMNMILKDQIGSKEKSYRDEIKKIVDEKITDSSFSLQVLARDMGFSSGYLSSLFKKEFGKSFQNYVLDIRLERAKILLLTTDMKNYEIANSVGIEDVNYFSVRFKKAYGLSPKKYKDSVGD